MPRASSILTSSFPIGAATVGAGVEFVGDVVLDTDRDGTGVGAMTPFLTVEPVDAVPRGVAGGVSFFHQSPSPLAQGIPLE